MKITQKLTDLEIANIEFQRQGKRGYQVSGEDTTKSLVNEDMTVVAPTPLTPEEEYCSRILTEQLEEAMELMLTEAQEALALNPNDEAAQHQIRRYNSWKKPGLIMVKGQKFKGQRATGVWVRTRDYGWLIKVSGKGTVVGEVVNVRKKGGQTIPMELTEEVVPNYFRAREV